MPHTYSEENVEAWTSVKKQGIQSQLSSSMNVESFFEEEEAVLQHFTFQIFLICGEIDERIVKLQRKRRWRVASSAAFYFRRFFATQSILLHDPRLIMLAAIFLAGKVEEHYKKFVLLPELKKIYKNCEDSDIHEAERKIVEELQFELTTYHPQNCMYTILYNVRTIEPQITSEMVDVWIEKCVKDIISILTTKASLSIPPIFIAYWCLHNTATSQLEKESLEKCIQFTIEQCGVSTTTDKNVTYFQNIVKAYLEQSMLGENFEKIHNFLSLLKPLTQWKPPQSVKS